MSFYTYYGKQGDDMFVVVLPNGTVEHGDTIYLYSKDHFTTHKAKDVSVTSEGEDIVLFGNAYFEYKATSKMGYRKLDLSLNNKDKSFNITLTRLYDLPLTAIPASDKPKIWTGIFNFHQWANTESMMIVAPKGVGHDKPVVCLWQWTKDNKGVKNTLSTSHSKQIVDAASPSTFTFTQNDYYTLDCVLNATTQDLKVIVKSPDNKDSGPLDIKLAAEVKLGSDHSFAPPRPAQQKKEFDCSRPQTTPALPRMNGVLPFPGNLVDTLTYSAAFVDQAGYLAKHAVKQFNQLEKSFQQLEIKSEARGAKVIVLEGEVKDLKKDNDVLKKDNDILREQAKKNAKEMQELRKSLQELRGLLSASRAREEELKIKNALLEEEKKKLELYVEADRLADIAREMEFARREKKFREHDALDHAALERAQLELAEALVKLQELNAELDEKTRKVETLEVKLEHALTELRDAKHTIKDLTEQLKVERDAVKDLEKKLGTETDLRKKAEKNLECALIRVDNEIAARKKAEKDAANEKARRETAEADAKDQKYHREKAEKRAGRLEEDLQDKTAEFKKEAAEVKRKEKELDDKEHELDDKEEQIRQLREKQDRLIARHQEELKEAREDALHDDKRHGQPRVLDASTKQDAVSVSATEIVL